MPDIHEHNWGTIDFAVVLPGLIYITDYKHGHREVSARDNFQLIDYLAGLVHEHGIDGLADQHTQVVIRIVHPFCYTAESSVSEWRCMLSDLRPYFNQLTAKAHDAFNNPTFTSGPWCRDCKAVLRCDTAKAAAHSLIDYAKNQPLMTVLPD